MKDVSIKELIDWILLHRGNSDAFKDYPINKIVEEIKRSIMCKCFLVDVDSKDNIIGVVCGEKFEQAKCILVHDLLITHPEALKKFWQKYLKAYPHYTLVGGHKGKMKTFYKAKV